MAESSTPRGDTVITLLPMEKKNSGESKCSSEHCDQPAVFRLVTGFDALAYCERCFTTWITVKRDFPRYTVHVE
jgi:hypothetical protein